MTNDNNESPSWLNAAPTWLHLIVAVAAMAGSMILFLTQVERRFTIIEERQTMIRQQLRDTTESTDKFRSEVIGKIDAVGTQMALLTLEFAKLQARYANHDDEGKPRYK